MVDDQKHKTRQTHHTELAQQILTQILDTGRCQVDSSELPHPITAARWRRIARTVGDGLGCSIATINDGGILRACVPDQPEIAAEFLARDYVATEPPAAAEPHAKRTRRATTKSRYR